MAMTAVPPYDPEAGGPAYTWQKIAAHLAARITAGEFAPGAMLPGERALAGYYGVALNTIRRALRELAERGTVVTLPAKGTFVTRRDGLGPRPGNAALTMKRGSADSYTRRIAHSRVRS
jgi:DNA-binding GntR family transcriptional regulator